VTDRKVCEDAAALMASTAMSIEPSCRQRKHHTSSKGSAMRRFHEPRYRIEDTSTLTVPFLNPTDIDSAEVSSRWTCDSVVRAPIAPHELKSARYCGEMTSARQLGRLVQRCQLTKELSSSRKANLSDVQQQFSGNLETPVDLVRAVHVRVWREPCPNRKGPSSPLIRPFHPTVVLGLPISYKPPTGRLFD